MSNIEALELVKLCMKEDGLTWAQAYKEYRHLTQQGLSATFNTGKHLQVYAQQLEKMK